METLLWFDWLIFIAIGTLALISIRRQLALEPIAAPVPLVTANLPWIITGVGKLLYPGRDTFDLYDLRLGVLPCLLVASDAAVWATLIIWLFRGGAEQIASSPETARAFRVPENASMIKALSLATLAGGVIGVAMMVITATEQPR